MQLHWHGLITATDITFWTPPIFLSMEASSGTPKISQDVLRDCWTHTHSLLPATSAASRHPGTESFWQQLWNYFHHYIPLSPNELARIASCRRTGRCCRSGPGAPLALSSGFPGWEPLDYNRHGTGRGENLWHARVWTGWRPPGSVHHCCLKHSGTIKHTLHTSFTNVAVFTRSWCTRKQKERTLQSATY